MKDQLDFWNTSPSLFIKEGLFVKRLRLFRS